MILEGLGGAPWRPVFAEAVHCDLVMGECSSGGGDRGEDRDDSRCGDRVVTCVLAAASHRGARFVSSESVPWVLARGEAVCVSGGGGLGEEWLYANAD